MVCLCEKQEKINHPIWTPKLLNKNNEQYKRMEWHAHDITLIVSAFQNRTFIYCMQYSCLSVVIDKATLRDSSDKVLKQKKIYSM